MLPPSGLEELHLRYLRYCRKTSSQFLEFWHRLVTKALVLVTSLVGTISEGLIVTFHSVVRVIMFHSGKTNLEAKFVSLIHP